MLKKPRTNIESVKGKELANELRDFAKRQNIDLSLADLDRTRGILKRLPTSLSEEIVKMREGRD